jgi:HPt (histidine-containing phosphotransfer) domain-containing protein
MRAVAGEMDSGQRSHRAAERGRRQVLDPRVLAALQEVEQESVQAGLVRHVIMLYLQQTPPRLAALQKAVAQQDVGLVEEIAHSLMGSSQQIGATQMATLSVALQDSAHDPARATVQVAQLTSEFVHVRAALEAVLQANTA